MPTYAFDVNGEPYEVEGDSEDAAREALIQFINEQEGFTQPAPQEGAAPPEQQQAPTVETTDPWAAQAAKIRAAEEGVSMPADAARPAAAGATRLAAGAGSAVVYSNQAVTGFLGVDSPMANLSEYNSAANDLLTAIRGKTEEEQTTPEMLIERGVEMGLGWLVGAPAAASYRFKEIVKAGTKAGAFAAATTFDDADTLAEKTGSIALGSLAGMGLSTGVFTITGAPKAAHKWWVGKLAGQRDEAQRKAIIALEKHFPELKSYLTLGMRTGSLGMIDAEARAAGKYALETYRRIAGTLQAGLQDFGRKYGSGFAPDELAAQVATRGRAAGRAYLRDLKGVRKQEWDAMMDSAKAAITSSNIAHAGVEGAEQLPIPVPGSFRQGMIALADKYDVKDINEFGPQVQRFLREVETFKGNVSLETLHKTLVELNTNNFAVTKGKPEAVQDAIGAEFKQLIFNMIDDTPDGVHDAITWIKRARMSYSGRSAQIEEFQKSAVAKALQLERYTPDPLRGVEQFRTLSAAQQMRARDILGTYDPKLLNEIRGHFWDEALQKAANTSQGDPARMPGFEPAQFISNMMDGDELRLSGLFSDADRAMIKEILPSLRAIYFRQQNMARAPEMENIVMTGAQGLKSMANNAAFQARQVFRFYNKFFDQRYFTPQGRAALKAAANETDPTKFAALMGRLEAMGGTTNLLFGMEPE